MFEQNKNNLRNLSDEDLLEYIKEYNEEAFDIIVERHSKRFYLLAYKYTNNYDNADDILQISFMKLWQKPYLWNREKNVKFTTWFYKVVLNTSYDWLRKNNKNHTELSEEITNDKENNTETENKLEVKKIISKLPNKYKKAIILYYIEDLSYSEAAKFMNITTKSFEAIIYRAKKKLKILFES